MKYLLGLALVLAATTVWAEEEIPEYATGSFNLMRQFNVSMVSTLEGKKPYGSVMPYCLDEKGRPVVYISDLAVHTDNINKNPNSSVMVFKPDAKGNVFNGSRVTLSGKFRKVAWDKKADEKEHDKLAKLYVKEHPDAKQLLDFADFNFYVLEISSVYYIGGFGEIGSVEVKEYERAAARRRALIDPKPKKKQ